MIYKVVYNNCYGGFCLSKKGALWILNRMSEDERNQILESMGPLDTMQRAVESALTRHDLLLVDMVNTLGSAAAGGSCSRLQIEEIDKPLYYIADDHGLETVITPTDRDWIKID